MQGGRRTPCVPAAVHISHHEDVYRLCDCEHDDEEDNVTKHSDIEVKIKIPEFSIREAQESLPYLMCPSFPFDAKGEGNVVNLYNRLVGPLHQL